MSVINDMLTALDARRAVTPAGMAAVPAARGTLKSRRVQIMLVLGATAVTATALADWPQLLAANTRTPQPLAIVDAAPLAADAAAAAPVQPGALTLAIATATATTPASLTPRPVAAPPSIAQPSAQKAAAVAQTAALTPTASAPAHAAPLAALPAPAAKGTAEKHEIALSAAQRAALAYRQALDMSASGHSGSAIDRALEALQADPDHAGARQLAAVLMFEARRLDEAGTLLRAGLERAPQQPRLAYLLARLRAEIGDPDGALALLPGGVALAGEAHGLRAAILARQGRFKEALPAYEAALRQDASNAAWWLGLGLALEANDQIDLARQALRRARGLGTLGPDVQTYVEQKLASLG